MAQEKHLLTYEITLCFLCKNPDATDIYRYGFNIYDNGQFRYGKSANYYNSRIEAECGAFDTLQWLSQAIDDGILEENWSA